MELTEFEGMLSELDGQIAKTKARAERRAKREPLEKKLRETLDRIAKLEPRVLELEKMGERVPEKIARFLAEQKDEAQRLKNEIAPLLDDQPAAPAQRPVAPVAAPPPPPEPARPVFLTPLSQEEKRPLYDLLIELDAADIRSWEPDEQRLQVRFWALQYRTLAERLGQGRCADDRDFKRCYAKVSEMRERYLQELLPALNRSSRAEWEQLLIMVERELSEWRDEKRRQTEMFEELSTIMAALPTVGALRDGEEVGGRRFRHLVRELAKREALRFQLAEAVLPYRAALEPEFSFLWDDGQDDEPPVEPGRHLSNREILTRMLRRMVRKGIVGGRNCPVDMIVRGFPPHDTDRAKEALAVLDRGAIVILAKSGKVVSLDQRFTKSVKSFVDGGAMGVPAVDQWSSADEVKA